MAARDNREPGADDARGAGPEASADGAPDVGRVAGRDTDLPANGAQAWSRLIGGERPDLASLVASIVCGVAYALVAGAILLSQQDTTLAIGLWPPNACVAALLLHRRFANEWLVIAAVLAGGMAAQIVGGFTPATGMILSAANGLEILLAVVLTRHWCGGQPDMVRLGALSRFIWAGGVIAPLASAALASLAMSADLTPQPSGAITWALTGSMAMILIVPTVLLLCDRRVPSAAHTTAASLPERIGLLVTGMACALVVFAQSGLPLMFVIPPITLLHAFRLGARGTAVYVLAVAGIAAGLTMLGHGPIAAIDKQGVTQLLLLQVFVSANFLTGLPVAAILASRAAMIDRLAERKRVLAMLTSNIGDAVLHYDLARVCTYASPSVREVLGVDPATYVGRPVGARLHDDTREAIAGTFDRLCSGTAQWERLTYRRFMDGPDGRPVWLEADCRLAHDGADGAISGVVVAVRDVTARVELEAQLRLAREQAEQVAQLKSEFLANMSHEIRTPMNGVLGFAEMMLEADLAPQQRRHAELIVQSGRSMMLLLNDILDLSKIEAGQFTIDESPVDLHATLSECAALHRPDAERKGVALRFECDCGDADGHALDPSLRHWVMTDGLRLRQIILNLLGNAVKFTDSGTIRLSYHLSDDQLTIAVEDSGIGIDVSRFDTIFSPFSQGGGAATRPPGGTGLGLSISRKLADLLGGTISVASQLGAGSRFTLTLPAVMAPPQARPPLPLPAAEPVALPPAARILLAEDHDVNRMLMCEMLERCGQSVAMAYDGTEAIAMVIESIIRGRPYDLVLMDVQMPGCDGYSAARAIRAEGIGADILPIIALTANAFPADIAAARAAGMQAHLAKPVMMADLARTLQRWLPTRIVEITQSETPPTPLLPVQHTTESPAPRMSARTWHQWLENRTSTLAAVACALAEGGMAAASGSTSGTASEQAASQLMRLVHNLAGSAAAFGEVDLGKRAAALETAMRKGASREVCERLARSLLAAAPAASANDDINSDQRRAR